MLEAVLGIFFGIAIGASGTSVAISRRLEDPGTWRTALYAALLGIIAFTVAFYLLYSS